MRQCYVVVSATAHIPQNCQLLATQANCTLALLLCSLSNRRQSRAPCKVA